MPTTRERADFLRDRISRMDAWVDTKRGRNGWASYHPEDVPADVPKVTNEERAELEVYDWLNDPPSKYFAYYKSCAERGTIVTTWMGDKLGTVVCAGLVWRSNMGDKRRAITVQGTNGVQYSGTAYLDSGDYCRLRRIKATEYVVQGAYGQGWEDVTTEDTRAEARQRLIEYNENEPQYSHRIITRKR